MNDLSKKLKAPNLANLTKKIRIQKLLRIKSIKMDSRIVWRFLIIIMLIAAVFIAKKTYDQNTLNKYQKQIIPAAVKQVIKDPSVEFKIGNIRDINGVYEFQLTIISNNNPVTYTSYITQDGKILFTSGIKIDELNNSVKGESIEKNTQAATNIPKNDKPEVELFVMSYCPYGTQIEKGILPAVNTLKDKINFSLKFVSYAMHGEKEIDENLKQYCIQKEEQGNFSNYLSCFLQEGNSAKCLVSANIDTTKLTSCISQTDLEFNIKGKLNDKSTWSNSQFPPFDIHKAENGKYNVQGSPTLVINGVIAQTARDSASLLKTICSSFSKQPSVCNANLSTAAPAPGFGTQTTDSNSSTPACEN